MEKKEVNSAQPKNVSNEIRKFQEDTIDSVLKKITAFQETGMINLPKDYSAGNALKGAWLILQDTKTKDKRPVLEVCNKSSIAEALFKMVVMGLNPIKKQCDFLAYGDKLTCQPEYHGNIALAKRYAGINDPIANVIYEKDDFIYSVDPETGRKKIIKHEQKIENIDIEKIRGAYCVIVEDDGQKYIEIMSMPQIRKSWEQGPMAGQSGAHKNFTDEMCKKTVINRACKHYINSSDDAAIMDDSENIKTHTESVKEAISKNANKGDEIGFTEEAQVIYSPAKEEVKEDVKKSEPEF